MKKYFVLWAVLASLYFLISALLFTHFPPIWPDETWYADVAHTILHKGIYGSTLLGDVLGSNTRILMYPPLLFRLYALAYYLFGFGPYIQRALAFVAGTTAVLLFLYMGKKALRLSYSALLAVAFFFITDSTFMRASHFGRPEIYILMLHAASYVLVVKFNTSWADLSAGILIGISILLQPYGAIAAAVLCIYILLDKVSFKTKLVRLSLICVPIFVCLLWWLTTLDFRIDQWLEGMHIQSLRKRMEVGFFSRIVHHPDRLQSYSQLSLFVGSCLILVYGFANPISISPLILTGLGVSWLFIFTGKQFWYDVYAVPFLYLSYGSILTDLKKRSKNVTSIFLLLCIGSVASIAMLARTIDQFSGNSHSYNLYTNAVAKAIPHNSTVLISSIPDPYFALKKDTSITMYQFVGLPNFQKLYIHLLDISDYVVYNGTYDVLYGDLLPRYIEKNKQTVIDIYNGSDQYQGYVIKLVPKNKRRKI